MIHVDEIRIHPGYIPNETDGYHYWVSVFSAHRRPTDTYRNPRWNATPDLVGKACVYTPTAISTQYSRDMPFVEFVRVYRTVVKCFT